MEMTNGLMFRILYNMMQQHITFSRGTYNIQDPTQYEDGTAYVSMDYNPLATNQDDHYEPKVYQIRYQDVTWGVNLYVEEVTSYTELGVAEVSKPFPNDIYMDHDRDEICRDLDEKIVQNFILAILTCGVWSAKQPRIDHYDEPQECPRIYM